MDHLLLLWPCPFSPSTPECAASLPCAPWESRSKLGEGRACPGEQHPCFLSFQALTGLEVLFSFSLLRRMVFFQNLPLKEQVRNVDWSLLSPAYSCLTNLVVGLRAGLWSVSCVVWTVGGAWGVLSTCRLTVPEQALCPSEPLWGLCLGCCFRVLRAGPCPARPYQIRDEQTIAHRPDPALRTCLFPWTPS